MEPGQSNPSAQECCTIPSRLAKMSKDMAEEEGDTKVHVKHAEKAESGKRHTSRFVTTQSPWTEVHVCAIFLLQ